MKFRLTIVLDVPDDAVFAAYHPVFHDEIRAREPARMLCIAKDALYRPAAGGGPKPTERRLTVEMATESGWQWVNAEDDS